MIESHSMYVWLEMLCKDMYHRESEILFSPLMLYFWKACSDLQLHSKYCYTRPETSQAEPVNIIIAWAGEYQTL